MQILDAKQTLGDLQHQRTSAVKRNRKSVLATWCYFAHLLGEESRLQWNLRTRDTGGGGGGGNNSVPCREVVPISEVRKNNSMGSKQVSFVERSSLSQRVSYRRFHCICQLKTQPISSVFISLGQQVAT